MKFQNVIVVALSIAAIPAAFAGVDQPWMESEGGGIGTGIMTLIAIGFFIAYMLEREKRSSLEAHISFEIETNKNSEVVTILREIQQRASK